MDVIVTRVSFAQNQDIITPYPLEILQQQN
jgi:hypothetical protein